MPTIGVLAVQGAFSEHINAFKKALLLSPDFQGKGIEILEIRSADDITKDMVGIVLPGGKCLKTTTKALRRRKIATKNYDFFFV